jgi:hypothetical protein
MLLAAPAYYTTSCLINKLSSVTLALCAFSRG